MTPLLEVIAQSVEDALEAEAGGANRLELVQSLDVGGLTPSMELLEAVLRAVRIPVRVMLRERPSMTAGNAAHRELLLQKAAQLGGLPIDGVVAGFLKEDAIDEDIMAQIGTALAGKKISFHRAFDELRHPPDALEQIRSLPTVDRVLTAGGQGQVYDRARTVLEWQELAGSAPVFLFAPGLAAADADAVWSRNLKEVHVGRAVRVPATHEGQVDGALVAALRARLSGAVA